MSGNTNDSHALASERLISLCTTRQRCNAENFLTHSGKNLNPISRPKNRLWADRTSRIDQSSRPFSGGFERGRGGGISREKGTVRGKRFTTGTTNGRKMAPGSESTMRFWSRPTRTANWTGGFISSMALPYAFINTAAARKKKRRAGHRGKPRRSHDQGSHSNRQDRTSQASRADGRSAAREHSVRAIDEWRCRSTPMGPPEIASGDGRRRQGIQCQAHSYVGSTKACTMQYPAQIKRTSKRLFQQIAVSPTQPGRTCDQSIQRVPVSGNTLRKVGPELPESLVDRRDISGDTVITRRNEFPDRP